MEVSAGWSPLCLTHVLKEQCRVLGLPFCQQPPPWPQAAPRAGAETFLYMLARTPVILSFLRAS